MAERREPGLDLNRIGDPVPTLDTPVNRATNIPPHVAPKRSGAGTGILVFLIIVLLFAAAGLGYWGMQIKRDMDEQRILIEQMNLWLESTDATLSQTNTSASQSGETLMGRLERVNTRLEERIKHFDSEIAKLWTISFQRNKPQLEAQEEQLKVHLTKLAEQEAALEVIRSEMTNQLTKLAEFDVQTQSLTGQVTKAVAGVETQEAKLEQLQDTIKNVADSSSQLGSNVEFQLSVERDERAKLQSTVNAQLQKMAAQGGKQPALEARIAELEQLISGIDASRRSLTAKLLELQTQVSGLPR